MKFNKILFFAGKEISKGALQAVGGIFMYVIVLMFILKYFFSDENKKGVRNAMYAKTPGLYKAVEPSNS